MPDASAVHRYHDGTKHHFQRFARSLGYLDWASQPNPFRRFSGAPEFALYPAPGGPAAAAAAGRVEYEALYDPGRVAPAALSAAAIGDVLRHALGLTAWKEYRGSRWSLRANPSSGNLHPTEAYVVAGAIEGIGGRAAVFHYAPDRHVLERRVSFDADAWPDPAFWLLALTSIHWRESWKYGERAFRYCQHDLGHAIAATRLACALVGWTATLVPEWPHRAIAAIAGIDRDVDYIDAEREEPACILAIGPGDPPASLFDPARLLDAVRQGVWTGAASQLSEAHVQWTFIDEIAAATVDPGRAAPRSADFVPARPQDRHSSDPGGARDARRIIVTRRSAVAFEGSQSIESETLIRMLSRVQPAPRAPWDALWWTPRIHLAVFVHRVNGVPPGLYFFVRDEAALDRLKQATDPSFRWEPTQGGLFQLAIGDVRELSGRLCCGQDIASDGFFMLGMIADFDASLAEHGSSFYRHLFWESGVVGQVLYLEAEAAGVRSTGIGCFFDDPVHEVLGLRGHAFQSLYHFTVGSPIDDHRLTTEPGYSWERGSASR